MDQLIAPTISGIFALIVALVPRWLEMRRDSREAIQALVSGTHHAKPVRLFLYLAAVLVLSDIAVTSAVNLVGMGAIKGSPSHLAVGDDDLSKYAVFDRNGHLQAVEEKALYRRIHDHVEFHEKMVLYSDLVMVIVLLFLGRHTAHRSNRQGIWLLAGAVMIFKGLNILTIVYTPGFRIGYIPTAILIALIPAFAGYFWGKVTRFRYLFARICDHLEPPERRALLDLALQEVEQGETTEE